MFERMIAELCKLRDLNRNCSIDLRIREVLFLCFVYTVAAWTMSQLACQIFNLVPGSHGFSNVLNDLGKVKWSIYAFRTNVALLTLEGDS